MEAYSYSSSSSSYLFENYSQAADYDQGLKEEKLFQSSLRSVRKTPSKPWKKAAIAPPPPTRPRVYKVDPVNFRDLVQKLTGAPELQPQRLRSVAPPPLSIGTPSLMMSRETSSSPITTPFSALYKELMMSETPADTKPQKMTSDWPMMSNSIGLSLSPASHNWFAHLLSSPGSLSGLEQQSTVL